MLPLVAPSAFTEGQKPRRNYLHILDLHPNFSILDCLMPQRCCIKLSNFVLHMCPAQSRKAFFCCHITTKCTFCKITWGHWHDSSNPTPDQTTVLLMTASALVGLNPSTIEQEKGLHVSGISEVLCWTSEIKPQAKQTQSLVLGVFPYLLSSFLLSFPLSQLFSAFSSIDSSSNCSFSLSYGLVILQDYER